MKGKFLVLLCICLLLSGCQTPVQPTEPTTVPMTVSVSVPLLEQGTALEEDANLLYIPCESLEQMSFPELYLLGNALLLSEFDVNAMDLKLISLEDGTLIAEAAVPAAPATTVFVGSGEIALCDSMSGKVTILDEKLHVVKSYDVEADGDDWYLDSALDTLYIFTADSGLVSVELETGAETRLVDNGFRVFCKGRGDDCLIFSYVDRVDQKTYNHCLNLSTGTLEPHPIKGPILEGTRIGDTWLIRHGEANGCYTLICDGAQASFTWTDSNVSLLPARQELLVSDLSGRNLMLYGLDGSFRGSCALPVSSEAFVASDLLWSEYWGGYFFADFTGSSCRLMFWDVQEGAEGERLEILAEGDVQPSEPLLEPLFYEWAAELSRRFGVEILIGEQCSEKYSIYETAPLTDPLLVSISLDTLEYALSQYPDGFFSQLCCDSVEMICFEVVDGLSFNEDGLTHPPVAAGLAHKESTRYTIALDGNKISNGTIYHEIAHIITARLEWDSMIREDAIYSEDAWMALQPEGFTYAMVYRDVPEEYQQYIDAGYFINDYSMTFLTEDCSEVMSEAMELEYWRYEQGSGLRAKLQFYADCIRDCFDTTGWPEVTRWELVLE